MKEKGVFQCKVCDTVIPIVEDKVKEGICPKCVDRDDVCLIEATGRFNRVKMMAEKYDVSEQDIILEALSSGIRNQQVKEGIVISLFYDGKISLQKCLENTEDADKQILLEAKDRLQNLDSDSFSKQNRQTEDKA